MLLRGPDQNASTQWKRSTIQPMRAVLPQQWQWHFFSYISIFWVFIAETRMIYKRKTFISSGKGSAGFGLRAADLSVPEEKGRQSLAQPKVLKVRYWALIQRTVKCGLCK